MTEGGWRLAPLSLSSGVLWKTTLGFFLLACPLLLGQRHVPYLDDEYAARYRIIYYCGRFKAETRDFTGIRLIKRSGYVQFVDVEDGLVTTLYGPCIVKKVPRKH